MKFSKVANICPRGDGSCGKLLELNTGAVASSPKGEKKDEAEKYMSETTV